jgi:hypothetical protein
VATLPALQLVSFSAPPEDEIALANPERLTELLRVFSLQGSVYSDSFSFTSAVWQPTAKALMEGMAVTKLQFSDCLFSPGECAAIMANGLTRNTSVTNIKVEWHRDEVLYSVLASTLPSNSTLRRLDLGRQSNDGGPDLLLVFLVFGSLSPF